MRQGILLGHFLFDKVYFWGILYATGYTFGAFFMRQGTGYGDVFHQHHCHFCSQVAPPPPRGFIQGFTISELNLSCLVFVIVTECGLFTIDSAGGELKLDGGPNCIGYESDGTHKYRPCRTGNNWQIRRKKTI